MDDVSSGCHFDRDREGGWDAHGLEIHDLREQAARSAAFDGHERVVAARDPATGLKAIIAIHDRTLGPALGGCRMLFYSSEDEALADVLRLSRAMTNKAALAGLALGGGKAVILGDPRGGRTEALFRAFGRFVNSLGGAYVTSEDVGTSEREMDWIALETRFVVGRSGRVGNPARVTAFGVCEGIKAALQHRFGTSELHGVTVAVQGLGHVGSALCALLAAESAALVVTDTEIERIQRAVQQFDARPVAPDAIFEVDAAVFAPCALGGVINDRTVPRLRCGIVAGAANNQLAEPRHGEALRSRGILYAPDCVINAGGLIAVAQELERTPVDMARAYAKASVIGATLEEIFAMADAEGIATIAVAERLARRRIEAHRAQRNGAGA